MTDRCTCHDVLIVKNLNRWFKEKWVDVSRKDKDGKHPPCGRSKAKKGMVMVIAVTAKPKKVGVKKKKD